MLHKEKPIEKRYLLVGEVCKAINISLYMFGHRKLITPEAIRLWEKEFDICPNRGAHRGYGFERHYTAAQSNHLLKIAKLLKIEGYTIKGAKRQLKLTPK